MSQQKQMSGPHFQEWQENFENIKIELERLYFARGMFERLNGHKNVKSCPNDRFALYLNNTYVVYLAMGIRRLIDKRSNAQNLYQILEDIKKNACEISVANYVEYFSQKTHRGDLRNEAERLFGESLGKNIQTLLCCDVQKDIDELKQATKKIEKLTNNYWAHMGKPEIKSKLKSIPFVQAHKVLELLIDLFNK